MTLEVKDAKLSEVIGALNAQWSVTILLDVEGDPRVSLSATDQPMIAVLDSLASLTGCLVWIGRGSVRFAKEDVTVLPGSGQFDNVSGGIVPYNPISGIFFNNESGETVNFNQDIRGRFEHIFDGALGNTLPPLVDTPVIQELLLRGRPGESQSFESWTQTQRRSTWHSGGRSEPMQPEEFALRTTLEEVQLALYVESVPLTEVLSKLTQRGDINIVLSDEVEPDSAVSIDIGRIKLRQALDLVCEQLELQWAVVGGDVLISRLQFEDGVVSVSPNANTRTACKVNRKRIEYTCEDTSRKSTVHRSFIRR